jgi:hypothetical protein
MKNVQCQQEQDDDYSKLDGRMGFYILMAAEPSTFNLTA